MEDQPRQLDIPPSDPSVAALGAIEGYMAREGLESDEFRASISHLGVFENLTIKELIELSHKATLPLPGLSSAEERFCKMFGVEESELHQKFNLSRNGWPHVSVDSDKRPTIAVFSNGITMIASDIRASSEEWQARYHGFVMRFTIDKRSMNITNIRDYNSRNIPEYEANELRPIFLEAWETIQSLKK